MADGTQALAVDAASVKPKVSRDDWIMRGGLAAIGIYMLVAVVFPLYLLLSKGFRDADGNFVGLANFAEYFSNPALFFSVYNSLTIADISTFITVGLGFGFAYGLTRSCMPGKGLFKAISLVPILAPSLLPAISLVYLFGNQGMIKELLMGESIYGPIGIVMGEVFWTFPHASIIILTTVSLTPAFFNVITVSASSWNRAWVTWINSMTCPSE